MNNADDMPAKTIQLDDQTATSAVVSEASAVLAAGGLVVFPTETVYGVGASVASDKGLARLREVKQRPDSQPFTIHLPDAAAAERYIDLSSPKLARLVRKVLPGPITLVVDVTDETIERCVRRMNLRGDVRGRLYFNNTVGLRCPDHPLGQAILGSIPEPVVASSANRRGARPPHDADEAAKAIGAEVDLLVDGGRCRYAKASTIVRVRGEGSQVSISVERDGVYDERYIRKMLRWTMLLVCTGNTCRSPMAEQIARQMLAAERGLREDELDAAGLRVLSAGVFAGEGQPASAEAVAALAKMGVDLSRHRSKPLSRELIHEADVIYTMTQAHREAVIDMLPSAADKTMALDPTGDIEDPIGSGQTVYQRCAEMIRRRLEARLKEQQP
jgi:protein-tyrosine phosphatase